MLAVLLPVLTIASQSVWAQAADLPERIRQIWLEGDPAGAEQLASSEIPGAVNRALVAHAIHPVIDGRIEMDQAKEALERLAAGRHIGKIVIGIDS